MRTWLQAAFLWIVACGATGWGATAQARCADPPEDVEPAPGAVDHDRNPGEPDPRGIPPTVPEDGFFPTPRMIEGILHRIAEAYGEKLELDDEQREFFEEVLETRVPQWLQRNKPAIKTLLNQYFEAVLADEPPVAADVAEWAQQMIPLVHGFQSLAASSVEDLRAALTDEQAGILDADMAAFNVGVSFARSKMELWAAGEYNPETDWPRGAKHEEASAIEEKAVREAQERARSEVTGQPVATAPTADSRPANPAADPAHGPEDAWTRYVREFCARYEFTREQTETAQRFLREARRLRDRYQVKRLEDFRRLESALRDPGQKDLEKLQADYKRLQAPLDRYFQQLKDRLDQLPTRAQRRGALEKDAAKPGAASAPASG